MKTTAEILIFVVIAVWIYASAVPKGVFATGIENYFKEHSSSLSTLSFAFFFFSFALNANEKMQNETAGHQKPDAPL